MRHYEYRDYHADGDDEFSGHSYRNDDCNANVNKLRLHRDRYRLPNDHHVDNSHPNGIDLAWNIKEGQPEEPPSP